MKADELLTFRDTSVAGISGGELFIYAEVDRWRNGSIAIIGSGTLRNSAYASSFFVFKNWGLGGETPWESFHHTDAWSNSDIKQYPNDGYHSYPNPRGNLLLLDRLRVRVQFHLEAMQIGVGDNKAEMRWRGFRAYADDF